MEICVSNLKEQLSKFEKKLEEYDTNYLNIYGNLGNSKTSWQDAKANDFFSVCDEKKVKVQTLIDSSYDLIGIYKFVVSKYEKLGDEIKVTLSEKNTILNSIDEYLREVDNIISHYQRLSLWFCPNEAYTIRGQLSKMKTNKGKIEDLRKEIKDIYSLIEQTEQEVNTKISRLNVEILKDINPTDYV